MTARVVLLFFAACLCRIHDPEGSKDPIGRLDQSYMAESVGFREAAALDRREFYERWLATFQNAIVDHPRSPYVGLARERAIELLNSLGRYAESVEALEAHRATVGSDRERSLMTYQIGEVAYQAAIGQRDKALARKSIDAFDRVRQMVPQPNEWGVIGLARSAYLESHIFGDHAKAAILYSEGVGQLPRLSAERRRNLGHWPNAEQLLQGMAVEYARAGQAEPSIAALDELLKVERRDLPMTLHLRLVLGDRREQRPPVEVCDYIADWLERGGPLPDVSGPAVPNPMSPEAKLADLKSGLAGAYRDLGELEQAISWYEDLVGPGDDPRPREDSRGPLGAAVSHLRSLYYQTGQLEKIKALNQRVQKWGWE